MTASKTNTHKMKSLDLRRLPAVELFAGIGGFRLAMDACAVDTVWANDVDPKAARVYRDRFGPQNFFEGDIRDLKSGIPRHRLLTGGFPCQPFSAAGKKLGISDPRGTLFQEIVDILATHQPDVFILENVKRLLQMEKGCHFATILAALSKLDYFIEWRVLNAMHFGLPQNRQRVIILGERAASRAASAIAAPCVRLAPPDDFCGIDDQALHRLHTYAEWTPISRYGRQFPTWGVAYDGHFSGTDLGTFSQASNPVTLASVLEHTTDPAFDFTSETLPRLSQNSEVNRFVGGVEVISNQGGGARMGYTIFGVSGVAPTLTSATSRHYERYKIGDRYRRLTNVEYARIQGFPDDHCREASTYDQYALYGNAVPPAMIRWVLSRLAQLGSRIPTARLAQLNFMGIGK